MYFPILRGRQNELLALRECLEKGVLSKRVIPIIEPVKVTTTFMKTLSTFIDKSMKVAIIFNPLVGSWKKEFSKDKNEKLYSAIMEEFDNSNIIRSYYVTHSLSRDVDYCHNHAISIDSLMFICNNENYIDDYSQVIRDEKPKFNLIPDKSVFRRKIRYNRIMCEDHFPKQARNTDYLVNEDEFFSSDHLYYKDEGYIGFSDYSIAGSDYSETGFAPYAVAIHITYLDYNKNLRVAHFVSDTNDDISDPARKFSEAVSKLVEWNKTMNLETEGMKLFIDAFENQRYPGLGVIKKYSIMHHLQLISEYLETEEVSK